MKFQLFIRVMVFAGCLCAPKCHGQAAPADLAVKMQTFRNAGENGDSPVVLEAPGVRPETFKKGQNPAGRVHKKQFVLLSVGVYAASLADMRQTMRVRDYPWWYEKDPLARQLVRLPAPAYYTAGLSLATGLNWISWRMGHSRRWHNLAFLPQVLSMAGNSYGFKSNRYANY